MSLALVTRTPDNPLSQGDIIRNVAVVDFDRSGQPGRERVLALVLSHSCELDKENNKIAIVCELRPMSGLSQDFAEKIRAGVVLNAVHVNVVPDVGDVYLDFRRMYRTLKRPLVEQSSVDRTAALADEACVQLATYLFRFLVRDIPPDLLAPTEPARD